MESAENREPSPETNSPVNESGNPSSLSKVETLKLLNESIDQLESTIKGISENSTKDLPSSDSMQELLNTTQELAKRVATAPKKRSTPRSKAQSTDSQTVPPPVEPSPASPDQPSSPTTKPKRHVPNVVASPKEKRQKKAGLITIIVFAITIASIALFWLWSPDSEPGLMSESLPKSAVPEVMKESNNSQNIAENIAENNYLADNQNRAARAIPSQIKAPRIETPQTESVDIAIKDDSSQLDVTLTNLEPEAESTIAQEIPIPQALSSPGRAKNLKIETIEPELTFTPEQTFVAALQTKIAGTISGSAADLVDSIQVNLPTSSLQIQVSELWYELNESRQSKMANDILQRSRQLRFDSLELKDSKGILVARNPVIGNQIIIVQSSQDS